MRYNLEKPLVEVALLPLCAEQIFEVMLDRVAAEDQVSLLLKPVEDELRKAVHLELRMLVFTRVRVEAVEELQEVVFLLVLDRVGDTADGLKLLDRF